MTSAITFKPKLAFITAVVAAVTAVLTYAATANPADVALFTGLASVATQGLSQYETSTSAGASTKVALASTAETVVTNNWTAIQAEASTEIDALVKDPSTNAIGKAVVALIGQKVAALAAANQTPPSPLAMAVAASTASP